MTIIKLISDLYTKAESVYLYPVLVKQLVSLLT